MLTMLIASLIGAYFGLLLGIFLATLCLILSGLSWGPLPHLYLQLIKFIQNLYPNTYPSSSSSHDDEQIHPKWPAIIERSKISTLEKHRNDSLSSFRFSENPAKNVFNICSDAFKAGFEAIAEDEISVAFNRAPHFHTTLLERPGSLPQIPTTNSTIKNGRATSIAKSQFFAYFIALIIRYGILLPIRFCLILSSFIYVFIVVFGSFFISFTKQQKTRLAVTYCRLFSAGIGLVATYHNRHLRPKQPGIAVSNHLSPNDIQIIYADAEPNAEYGYTVTGQKHNGIIWAIESLSQRINPALWFDRANPDGRKNFTNELIRDGLKEGPVLLFPEGYCTNNTRVLQFRRAAFADGITIYPIAIRQNARYGDSFWYEDEFWRYLLRLLTSWAIVYDVFYLEPQQRLPDEPAHIFAARVQNLIAEAANAERIDYDGRLWYKSDEQKRMRNVQMANLTKRFREILETTSSNSNTDSRSNDRIIENCDLIEEHSSKTSQNLLKTALINEHSEAIHHHHHHHHHNLLCASLKLHNNNNPLFPFGIPESLM